MQREINNYSTIILLGLIAIVGVFTLDVYLPGIPSMANEYNVSIPQICLTFTGFSIVFSVFQIFYGVMSDYYGRKPILLIGLFMAGLASLLCMQANNFNTFFAFRLMQALGISVFVVLNAIIRDLYINTQAIRVRTYVTIVSGIAPSIGGLLENKFGWRGGFEASLLLIVIAFLYTSMFFAESNKILERKKFRTKNIVNSYYALISQKDYLTNILMVTLAYTVHFSFIILSAQIFIKQLEFTPLNFGYLMFIYGFIYFLSGLVTSSLAKKVSIPSLLKFGSLLLLLGGMLLLGLTFIFSANVWNILIPISFSTVGLIAIRVAATTAALAPIPEKAGQGAACLNLFQFMFSALIATSITRVNLQPQLSIGMLTILCAVSIILLINAVQLKRLVPLME